MVSLEQVQLLETKVAKAIEYIQRLSSENAALASEKVSLREKLEVNQKRLDELETLVLRFKEDQGRIEDGIIAALDRLSQFEEAFENKLMDKDAVRKTPVKKPAVTKPKAPSETEKEFFEINESEDSDDELADDLLSDSALMESSSEKELDIF